MHELSIAHSLVELAAEAAERAGGARVQVVFVRIGALSGVVREALEFSFEIAAQGTPLEGSRIEIEELAVVVRCGACAAVSVLPGVQQFRCPRCDTPTADVVQGRELELVAIELADIDAEVTERTGQPAR